MAKSGKINKIYACWIYVSDLKQSIRFYQDIGFELKFVDDNAWAEFDLGETAFGKLLTFEDPDGHWLEFFENTRA